MAVLSVQSIPMTGAVVTYAAAANGGDSFPNGGTVRVRARNASAGAKGVNVEGQGVDNFGISHATAFDMLVSIPAAAGGIPGEKTFGPFPTNRFNDVNNRVQLAYPDGEADLSIAVVAD